MEKRQAFTLIELLIVVAIIAILAAIAVPNFLEAQVRSKVAASKADIRTLVLSIESYNVDWNDYPYYPDPAFASSGFMGSDNQDTLDLLAGYTPVSLTTPLAYMSALPTDVFVYSKGAYSPEHWRYENTLQLYQWDQHNTPIFYGYWDRRMPTVVDYIIIGVGPDGITPVSSIVEGNRFHNNAHEYLQSRSGAVGIGGFYDPSNGTVSPGDIVYHGPGLGFEPSVMRGPQ
jgi:prepilin-type N-terminal cleavage/methylation domain-containing protein